jgi:hypothetical protein
MKYMNTIYQLKKYAAMGAMAVAAVIYSGCTNLDESPYTFINPDSFYQTQSDVETALNNTYRAFRNMATSTRYVVAPLELATELGEPNYRKEQPYLDNINAWNDVNNVSYTFSNIWKNSYVAINDANIVLGRAENVSMDATEKARIEGQALFIRAYAFYYLVRIYGGCPIPVTYTSGLGGLKVPRESADKVWEQIFSDLKEAAEKLPERGTSGYDVWRASKGSCYALLGEAYLYKATISNEDNFSANKSELEESKKYSELVIKSGKYSLVPDYKNLWYWYNQDAKNNSESVFELQFFASSNDGNGLGVDLGTGNSSGIKGVAGTYNCRMGIPGDFYETYAENDARKAIILTNFTDSKTSVEYNYDLESQNWVSATGAIYLPENYAFHTLLNAKFFDPWADAVQLNAYPGANYPLLRYSEVLLNYAEAANLLSAGDGLSELNQVHSRALGTTLSSMSQKEMDEAILQERLWEFPGECKAYFDELRKGVIGEREQAFVNKNHAIYLKNEMLSSSTNSRRKNRFGVEMTFIPKKSFLWKIPQTDLDSNSMLEQTPDNESKK